MYLQSFVFSKKQNVQILSEVKSCNFNLIEKNKKFVEISEEPKK